MILDVTLRNGHRMFVGRGTDLAAATEWARCLCHLVFGPVAGELHFRKLPAATVLSLWARRVEA